MILHFRIIGALLLVLAMSHVVFPRYFRWSEELKPLSLINRQIMTIHTFFIALTVFLLGLLCLSAAGELVETALGRKISLGMGVFWGTRLVIQFVGYSPELWKGRKFETTVHVLFSLLFTYMSVVFLWAYFY
ncbi:hypothetical protein [Chitinophaga pinensis]|uniref:Uncharacterized protein n=1 Tax=Chitinophaga pinensis (strain ATCC 43595 / DSM 2588 / LMG 13176 / NBRC 15968 / NCIMB 11800 / UQM 2034) TaxID=485918 RepID=A0A979G700_CHIPD|nr:hypothetical protein [Chitinophaga pinensis]ACU61872.1 hypothetical protein Cpin_4428 [Chitinophaga pinensis DSM 2588]